MLYGADLLLKQMLKIVKQYAICGIFITLELAVFFAIS